MDICTRGRFLIGLWLIVLGVAPAIGQPPAGKSRPPGVSPVVTPVRLDQSRPGRYARSVRTPDGMVHLLGLFQVVDDGQRLAIRVHDGSRWGGAVLTEALLNAFFVDRGFFLSLRNRVRPHPDGALVGRSWRSSDDLRSLQEEEVRVVIPEAGTIDFGGLDDWAGLFFHRGLLRLSDGSLLASMYGNFEADRVRPTHPHSSTETKYKLRAFAVRSEDQGRTWYYWSSLAVPDPGMVDDSEGFNEWTMARLPDGRILAIIRTGHFTPMVACWSADEGRTWTPPRAPAGLGPAGVDPCLVALADGRLALAFGEMVQPPVPGSSASGAAGGSLDHRRRCRLAVSEDRGESWRTFDVSGYADRSAYSTIFELQPGVVLYQSDLEVWRVELAPH